MNKPRKTSDYAKVTSSKRPPCNYNSKSERIRLKKIVDLVGTCGRILDLGCYDGTLGRLLIKNNEVYGIEISEKVAEIARLRGLKVKIQCIESGFDFEDNFFDCVVAAEVIEHILDTDFFIGEIKRVLKPNGFFVVSTPNTASLGRRILLLSGKNPYFEASFGYPPYSVGHIRFFTKDLLLEYLKHKGFEIIKFTSDVVNVTPSGRISSALLATYFPCCGRSLIVKCRNIKGEK